MNLSYVNSISFYYSIKQLLSLGLLIGANRSKWNPKLNQYLLCQNYYRWWLLDLHLILLILKKFLNFLKKTTMTNGNLLFVLLLLPNNRNSLLHNIIKIMLLKQTEIGLLPLQWLRGYLIDWRQTINNFLKLLEIETDKTVSHHYQQVITNIQYNNIIQKILKKATKDRLKKKKNEKSKSTLTPLQQLNIDLPKKYLNENNNNLKEANRQPILLNIKKIQKERLDTIQYNYRYKIDKMTLPRNLYIENWLTPVWIFKNKKPITNKILNIEYKIKEIKKKSYLYFDLQTIVNKQVFNIRVLHHQNMILSDFTHAIPKFKSKVKQEDGLALTIIPSAGIYHFLRTLVIIPSRKIAIKGFLQKKLFNTSWKKFHFPSTWSLHNYNLFRYRMHTQSIIVPKFIYNIALSNFLLNKSSQLDSKLEKSKYNISFFLKNYKKISPLNRRIIANLLVKNNHYLHKQYIKYILFKNNAELINIIILNTSVNMQQKKQNKLNPRPRTILNNSIKKTNPYLRKNKFFAYQIKNKINKKYKFNNKCKIKLTFLKNYCQRQARFWKLLYAKWFYHIKKKIKKIKTNNNKKISNNIKNKKFYKLYQIKSKKAIQQAITLSLQNLKKIYIKSYIHNPAIIKSYQNSINFRRKPIILKWKNTITRKYKSPLIVTAGSAVFPIYIQEKKEIKKRKNKASTNLKNEKTHAKRPSSKIKIACPENLKINNTNLYFSKVETPILNKTIIQHEKNRIISSIIEENQLQKKRKALRFTGAYDLKYRTGAIDNRLNILKLDRTGLRIILNRFYFLLDLNLLNIGAYAIGRQQIRRQFAPLWHVFLLLIYLGGVKQIPDCILLLNPPDNFNLIKNLLILEIPLAAFLSPNSHIIEAFSYYILFNKNSVLAFFFYLQLILNLFFETKLHNLITIRKS